MYWSRWLNLLRMRLRSLLRASRVESDLAKELAFHLERQTAENQARGMTEAEARSLAERRLGALTQIEEDCRDMRKIDQFEATLRDLQYAGRTFLRAPVFAGVIILTMMLAIGATSAIFSVLEGVLLRPLPYPQADRLVRLFLSNSEFPKFQINPNDFRDYRDRARSFESLASYSRSDMQLGGSGQAQHLSGFRVSAGFFKVLGVKPVLGREFSRADELPGNGHSVILSHQLWRTRFSGQSGIVGSKAILNGSAYTVLGVMPAGVAHPGNDYHAVGFGKPVDIWVPFTFDKTTENRGSHFLDVVGRLKNGVTIAQAKGEMNAVMQQLGKEHEGDRGWHVTVTPLAGEIVGGHRQLLWVLLGAVTVVLLIACVNVANLLLSRATVRERELALRAAVGAKRSRLMRLLLTESLLLSTIGALLGGLLAIVGVKMLVALLPPDFPRASDIHVNATMFLFVLVVAVGTGILFGLAPAWQGARADLKASLHEGGRSATGSTATLQLRHSLVICEVGLACLLLAGAGLLFKSFAKLLHTEPGFRAAGVMTGGLSLGTPTYEGNDTAAMHFYEELVRRLTARPGISSVGVGTDLPWTGYNENSGFSIDGKKPPPHSGFHARYHAASDGYFRTLGIPLVQGRFFNGHDGGKGAMKTVIVNQAMARRYWPNEQVIGQRITFDDNPKPEDWLTIVGLVGDVKDTPASDGAEPAFWWPLRDVPFRDTSVLVRGSSAPNILAEEIRRVVKELDPMLAVADEQGMDEIVGRAYSQARFALSLIGLFAAMALILAVVGTYGVISYSMNQRRREFGLRIALGAQPADVLRFVFAHGMRLALTGVALGIGSSLVFGRLLTGLLYQVTPHDLTSIGGASLTVILSAALATYIPAHRATRSDPMRALRAE